jgi:hypothetical protein
VSDVDGVPNGSAMDSGGKLWTAYYGGGGLTKISPSGKRKTLVFRCYRSKGSLPKGKIQLTNPYTFYEMSFTNNRPLKFIEPLI